VTVALASVGVELQGLVRIVTTLIGDAGLDLLGVATAEARQVGWVGGVARRGVSSRISESRLREIVDSLTP